MTERDRQNSSLRTYEGDLHSMERKENTLSNQIRDKDAMEERIVVMTNDISALSARLKVFHFTSHPLFVTGSTPRFPRNWTGSLPRRKLLFNVWNRSTNRSRPS